MRRAHPPLTALVLLLLAIAGVTAFFPSESAYQDDRLVLTGPTMGTRYRVVIRHPSGDAEPARWQERIERRLDRIEQTMSTWRDDSAVSHFNRSQSTDWFAVHAPLARLVRRAQGISEAGGGAFDITIGPLIELWGFGAGGRVAKPPDDAAIREALKEVGHKKLDVRTDPPALRKDRPGVAIDLSGIAKGYAADVIAKELASLDAVGACLVEIGGELRAAGRDEQGGQSWRVGIESPTRLQSGVRRRVRLSGQGLATSGNYRNFFMHEGKRYTHTLDPRTGRPVRHRLASVSVAHDSAALADAWATALLVLGPEDGYKLAARRGLAAYFLNLAEEGTNERMTPAFRALTAEE